MATDRSVARVTVRQEGKWKHAGDNRDRMGTSSTARSSTSSTARSSTSSTARGGTSAREDRAHEEDPWQRVEALEAELERKERGLQDVIDRYERILAERERQLTTQDRTTSTGRQQSVLSTVFEYVTDR